MFLRQPGVPAFPEKADPDTYYLTPVEIMEVLRWGTEFFQRNLLFAPVRTSVETSLKVLVRSGIIGPDGGLVQKTRGCRSCGTRKIWAIALQLGSYFQKIILHAESDEKQIDKLRVDLRAFLRDYRGVGSGKRVVLLARTRDSRVRELEL